MALAAGTRLGAYEVTALIGAGGMGEVYRARDTKLQREVALKILPELFAADPERLARFKREAQLLASLNHPNIAAIYGLEEHSDVASGFSRTGLALVLEFVEGPTLADRIAQGPLPLDDALPIARQIAEALEAAHEQGIVHRDLKPANIKVRPDGTVKVLDFGLARAFGPAEAGHDGPQRAGVDRGVRLQPDLTGSPTITSPAATRLGTILGTAAYMSPEQARGRTVDKRTDIWAFGCVLYEMLAGRRAFDGDEVTDVLARVLEREPDLAALPPTTPASIVRLLRRALEKDRKRRLPDIGVARLDIDDARTEGAALPVGTAVARAAVTRERLFWAAATAAVAALTATVTYVARPAPGLVPEMRLQIEAPSVGTGPQGVYAFAISPDGRAVVFRSASPGGQPQLWLRPIAGETAQPLMGTEEGLHPFWSPDGPSIAFVANGQLKRLDLADGRIQTLAMPAAAGGTWNDEGTILFARTFAGPLFRVAATGGEATAITRVDPPQHSGHVSPQFLPDGRHFLFFAFGSPEGKGIYVGSLDSMDIRRLVRTDAEAVFALPDLVLYAQEGALLAQHLSVQTRELTGEPITVARQVAVDVVNGWAAVSTSPAGVIAYRSQSVEQQLVWFDRSGQQIAALGEPDLALASGGRRLAPDGRTIAYTRTVDGNADVWLMDTARATLRRLTVDRAADTAAIWSPDGTRIVFASDRRAGNLDVYEKPVSGAEADRILLETPEDKFPIDWSPDGRFILYRNTAPKTRQDLWVLPLFGDRKPFPVAQTEFQEDLGRFSPDGRWIAYMSDESGRPEIYVQPFPGPGAKVQIPTDGGTAPQWRGDGRELFFNSEDARLMAVSVTLGDSTVETGTPVALFSKPEGVLTFFTATPDGQRFLIPVVADQASPITILLNWTGARR